MRSKFHVLILGLAVQLFSLLSCVVHADEKIVVMATRSPVDPNAPIRPDYAVRNEVLKQAGYRLVMKTVPTKRMGLALAEGVIDAYSVLDSDGFDKSAFIRLELPTVIVQNHIYYRRSANWKPSWPPQDDFKHATGVTQMLPYLGQRYSMNLSLVSSGEAGALMVNSSRADYWIDPMRVTVDETQNQDNNLILEKIFVEPGYMWLRNDEEGRKLKKILDQGIADIVRNKQKFFAIWLTGLPDNDPSRSDAETLLNYIKDNYPRQFK